MEEKRSVKQANALLKAIGIQKQTWNTLLSVCDRKLEPNKLLPEHFGD